MVNKPKNKGTAFETAVVKYLRWALDDQRIDRMALHGSQDVGDIAHVYFDSYPVVIECKNTITPNYKKYWQQTLTEMHNADTCFAVLVRHRPGVGIGTHDGVGLQQAIVDKPMLDLLIANHNGVCKMPCSTMSIAKRIPRTRLYELPLHSIAHWLNHGLPLGGDDQ